MEIKAADVMKLRKMTGAGMMDCKKALTETDGDMTKAAEYLRERGVAVAAKKASRIASEGAVYSYVTPDCKTGALAEINCESDFVAKSDEFIGLCKKVAETVAVKNPASDEALLAETYGSDTVTDLINAATAKIGEKIAYRRMARYTTGCGRVETYIHMGGKIGVMLEVATDKDVNGNAEFAAACHDVAMHIAAFAPRYVRESEVPAEEVEHEKEILAAQARNEGKPEKIIEKMVQGRVEKFYKEVCLLEQPFVKNPDVTIEQLITEKVAKIGEKISVRRFVRYKLGEGLEKRVDDLAAEVAAQTAAMQK